MQLLQIKTKMHKMTLMKAEMIKKIKQLYSQKEDENTWSTIDSILEKLTKESVDDSYKEVIPLLLRSLLSERSKLSGTAVKLLKIFITKKKDEMIMTEQFVDACIKLCGRSNRVFNMRGEEALIEIAKNTKFSRFYKIVKENSKNLNKKIRYSIFKSIIEYLKLESYTPYLEILNKGTEDADSNCRLITKTYFNQNNQKQLFVRKKDCMIVRDSPCKKIVRNNENDLFRRELKSIPDKENVFKKIELKKNIPPVNLNLKTNNEVKLNYQRIIGTKTMDKFKLNSFAEPKKQSDVNDLTPCRLDKYIRKLKKEQEIEYQYFNSVKKDLKEKSDLKEDNLRGVKTNNDFLTAFDLLNKKIQEIKEISSEPQNIRNSEIPVESDEKDLSIAVENLSIHDDTPKKDYNLSNNELIQKFSISDNDITAISEEEVRKIWNESEIKKIIINQKLNDDNSIININMEGISGNKKFEDKTELQNINFVSSSIKNVDQNGASENNQEKMENSPVNIPEDNQQNYKNNQQNDDLENQLRDKSDSCQTKNLSENSNQNNNFEDRKNEVNAKNQIKDNSGIDLKINENERSIDPSQNHNKSESPKETTEYKGNDEISHNNLNSNNLVVSPLSFLNISNCETKSENICKNLPELDVSDENKKGKNSQDLNLNRIINEKQSDLCAENHEFMKDGCKIIEIKSDNNLWSDDNINKNNVKVDRVSIGNNKIYDNSIEVKENNINDDIKCEIKLNNNLDDDNNCNDISSIECCKIRENEVNAKNEEEIPNKNINAISESVSIEDLQSELSYPLNDDNVFFDDQDFSKIDSFVSVNKRTIKKE